MTLRKMRGKARSRIRTRTPIGMWGYLFLARVYRRKKSSLTC